jgi:hypothetical protein
MRNSMSSYAIILGCCFFSASAIADANKVAVKKPIQKISSELLEFFDEFSDDEDSVVQLLVEDKEGNIMIGGAAPHAETFRNKRFNQSASSLSTSSVAGEKP